jgi:nucleoside-diphosphate-sugar epimerase
VPLALITGVAGFIGSTLADRLVELGWTVRGVDAFTDAYDPALKRRNLEGLRDHAAFELVEADLCTADLGTLLDGVTHVFHQAGQPGIRESWAGFDTYLERNVSATHRLLTAVASAAAPLERFVYASSSSVYGPPVGGRSTETDLPRPVSPYGVSKLSAEHLAGAFARTVGVPTVSLRYFTVHGPRQRPDMAIGRIIRAALQGGTFPLYGTGAQRRDFTFVDDVVEANVLAATATGIEPGAVFNVCGGSEASLQDALDTVAALVGPVEVAHRGTAAGDVVRTAGDHTRLTEATGWQPRVSLREGIERHIAWARAEV